MPALKEKVMVKLKLVIIGAKGRMGTKIAELASGNPTLEVAARLDIGSKPEEMRAGKVVIDFSQPEASLSHLQEAAKQKKAYVLGTTGFSKEQERLIQKASRSIAIVRSSNMSTGVNVFFSVAQKIAKALPDYKVHIQETHHVHKKDAPSGTALQAGALIEKISKQKVTYESFREGEVVGDHHIIFTGPTDRIELVHHAESRDIFAAGALRAAQWVAGKKPGLYSMQDVLGL
jgi:4-hydroxy-tetrahydrodipicolinate reductase